MPLGPGARLGRYELLGPLGSGGMGDVYRARDPELEREVAVKVLPAGLARDRGRLSLFRHEARVVARLGHPNVVTIHDVGMRRGCPYLVTELLEGEGPGPGGTARRDPPAVRSRVRLVERICAKWGFPLWLAGARFMSGWCRAQERPDDEAIGEMRQGLEAWVRTGSLLETTHYAGLLATACASAGRVDEGLSLVRETLASIADGRNGERFQEAELHRLEGELLLRTTGPNRRGEAEACFRRAIEVARRQQAKSWELRATTSLARLLAGEGRRDEARAGLAAVYGWFSEGLDTRDLREARALLDER